MSVQEVPYVKTCERCGKEFHKSSQLSYRRWERSRFCSLPCLRATDYTDARPSKSHQDQEIPVELIQNAVARDSSRNLTEIAEAMEWSRKSRFTTERTGDSSRLKRAMGLRPTHYVDGVPVFKSHMAYKLAGEILRGAGLYPVDYDI